MSNDYDIQSVSKQAFFQFPKLLLLGEKYKDTLSANDRQAYVILKDRLSVSVKNNWIDEDNKIYFVYPNDKLAEILNVSVSTVKNIKKNLTNTGLLKERRTGRANRLYLQIPEPANDEEAKYIITKDQEILEDESKFSEEDKNSVSKNLKQFTDSDSEDSQKLPIFGKKAQQQPKQEKDDSSDSPKMDKNWLSDSQNLPPSYNNLLRTKDIKDYKDRISSHENNLFEDSLKKSNDNSELGQLLINDFIESESLKQIYGDKIINLMDTYSFSSYETFERYVNKLVYANREAEKELGQTIYFLNNHFFEEELRNAFLNVIRRKKSGQIKTSFSGYLFTSLKQVFINFGNQQKETSNSNYDKNNDNTYYNWLEC